MRKIIIISIFFVITILFHAANASAANWYVDNTANGSNNGTSWANAWTSFANITWASINAGDTIYISGGSTSKTYNETLTVGAAGTSNSNRITITVDSNNASHNGQVIIDGGGTRANGITMRDWVTIDGIDTNYRIKIRNFTAYGIVQQNDTITNGFKIRYVEIEGTSALTTNGAGIHIGSGQARNHVIEYNYVHDVDNAESCKGIKVINEYDAGVNDPANIEIRYNKVENVAEDGITVVYSASVHHNEVGPNTWGGAHHDGIVIHGDDVYVYDNIVHDFSQGIYASFFLGKTITDVRIYNNIIYSTSGSQYDPQLAQYPHGLSIKVEQAGGACAQVTGIVLFANNTIDRLYFGMTIDMTVSACSLTTGSGEVVFKNNLIYHYSSDTLAIRNVYCRNAGSVAGLKMNNNAYGGGTATQSWIVESVGSTSSFTTWKSWLDAQIDNDSQGDDNSFTYSHAAPFVDRDNRNYQLLSSSISLIDTGASLSSYFTVDKDNIPRPQGAAWDIGAYEYCASGNCPTSDGGGGDTGGNTGNSSGSDSSASGGSGCGFVKEDGKGQKAKGEGLAFAIMLIIALAGIAIARKLFYKFNRNL